MTTVLDIIEKGTVYLEKKGIDDARRHMQLLVTHQLGCSRVELYMQFDRPMAEEELIPLRQNLKRRGDGEPLQHILGTVEFYRREFKTDARALIPRPETEELASLILNATMGDDLRILDMGTGSGVLGLTLAAELGGRCNELVLADISEDALALAEENATLLGLSRYSLVQTDLFTELQDQTFHILAANLPYIAETDRSQLSVEVLRDPDSALFGGKDGLDILRDFIQQAPSHLVPGSTIALEIGHDQADAVEKMLQAAGFTHITTHKDLNGIARFPIAVLPGAPEPEPDPIS
ncbi:peptide chain release factor N(5)-glutamine methyltransferase [Verrucomicrobiaceae bacterium R5-34]|nr:peptide chain release factor N(5)-glutamine methyltransferase [Verrucomicrobiaceae bacterium R5-34]